MDEFCNGNLSSSDDENDEPVHRRPRILKERVNYFETMDDLDFLHDFGWQKIPLKLYCLKYIKVWNILQKGMYNMKKYFLNQTTILLFQKRKLFESIFLIILCKINYFPKQCHFTWGTSPACSKVLCNWFAPYCCWRFFWS